jgi:hypothetical protein
MINPDDIITARDRLVGDENNYVGVNNIADKSLIVRMECFQIPQSDCYFVDLVFHLNRIYRRRLKLYRGKEASTRTFKRVNGIIKLAEELGVEEVVLYKGERMKNRIQEIADDERN